MSNSEYKVTYRLTREQKVGLRREMDKFKTDGHYGAAYQYLYDNVPKQDYHNHVSAYTQEAAGVKMWLSVAKSTNSHSGDITDRNLRSLTQEVMN